MPRRRQGQPCGDADVTSLSVRPRGESRAVDERVKTEAAIGRCSDDIEKRVERYVFEIGRDLAVDRNGGRRGTDESVAAGATLLGIGVRAFHGSGGGGGG